MFYRVLLGFVSLAIIYLTSLYSFLLFHITVELLSIIICFSIFIVAWNSRKYTDNNYFTFLGIAYLYVGIIELLQTLAFDGMPFFTEFGINVQTQLWITARYIQSLSLLAAIIFIKRRLRIQVDLAVFTILVVILILCILLWKIFPTAYIPGQGLTLFKISSEFIVCSILMIAGALLWTQRNYFDRSVLLNIMMSICFSILAELSFMLYRDSTNVFYMLGHLFYIVSFFLIFRAITVIGLQQPYDILFHNLASSRDLLQKERDKLQNILDLEESIMLALDSESRVTLINRKGREIIGADEQDIMGKKWFDNFVPERVRKVTSSYFSTLISEQADPDKYYNNLIVNVRGEERLITWHNELLRDESGTIIGTFSSGQDITERKQAEEMFQAIFNTSPVGMYIAQNHKFQLVNPQFITYVEYSEKELTSKDTLSLVEPEDRDSVRENATKSLKSGRGHYSTFDYRVKTRSGKQVWFMESDTSIIYNGKRATLGTIVDISERKQAEELFKSLSLIDDLTGLYNRRGFLMLASKQLKLSNRLNRGVTVLFADIDKLKWINDNLGHIEGDLALINTGKILKETFRDSDIIARMHGDEFAVLMAGSDMTFSETIRIRLQNKLKEFNVSAKKPYELSLSVGTSFVEAGQPCDLNELLETADKSMYEVKRRNS